MVTRTSYALWNLNIKQESFNHIKIADSKAVLKKVSWSQDTEIWKYKSSITKIVFENTIHDMVNATESFDISENQNKGVIAHLLANDDNTTYTVHIQARNKIFANIDSLYLFSRFSKLTSIEGLEYFDTSEVANMSYMFFNCSSLESLDLSNFDTSQVKYMDYMFAACSRLIDLDISNFDTSRVINMSSMFGSCSSLESLDLSNFNTGQVTNMASMFLHCSSLKSINLESFNTNRVKDMSSMFSNCSRLESLNLGSFDTRNVINIGSMFSNCKNLLNIIYGDNFICKITEKIYGMYANCLANRPTDSSWDGKIAD